MVAWGIMNPTCIIRVKSEMIFWRYRVRAQGEGTFKIKGLGQGGGEI
jgi:hypothetical protein